jgi:predicted enzyme related to lactoylglutathione lyase
MGDKEATLERGNRSVAMPNPFAHVELNTDDLNQAKQFYATVFAWKLEDMPAVNYTMIDVKGGTGGGMQTKPMPQQPTAWLPYVSVDDVKKTLAKAASAGAQVVLDYQEIGEMGAIGVFVDPQGAALGVWQAGPGAAVPPPAKKRAAKKAPAKKAKKSKAAPAKKSAKKAKKAAKKAPAKKAKKRRKA